MYREYVQTQEEALCHLFFHCCLKDGVFEAHELDQVAEKIVEMGLRSTVNAKEEIVHYNAYRNNITDETDYLQYLIELINPVNELALYSHCLELMLSDSTFDVSENALSDKIATVLNIDEESREVIRKLMVQRKVLETDKIF